MIRKGLEVFAGDDGKSYEQFGKRLKLGAHEDSTGLAQIAELMRYRASQSGDEATSPKVSVDCMQEGHNDMHCITGESVAAASSSPCLETLRKKGLEVMHMTDPIDTRAGHQLREFDGKKLKPTTEEGLDLEVEDESTKLEEMFGDKVEKLAISSRIGRFALRADDLGVRGEPPIRTLLRAGDGGGQACSCRWQGARGGVQTSPLLTLAQPLPSVLPNRRLPMFV